MAERGGPAHRLAAEVAAELGWLPLALEQAASYLEATGMSPAAYLDRFRARKAVMLTRGEDLAYGGTVDTCWSLALDRLQSSAPAAAGLLELAAFYGSDPVPLAWFTPGLLDGPLREAAADGDLDDLVAAARRYSLARRVGDGIQLHRLVAAVIRAHLPPGRHAAVAACARGLLATARPAGDHRDPAGWPAWAVLAAHTLAAPALHAEASAAGIGTDARRLLLDTTVYLWARGDYRAAHRLATGIHRQWAATLGADHPHTLWSTHNVALASAALGDYRAAQVLDTDTLARRRRLLGDDHPSTLFSANNLAYDLRGLGEHRAARALDTDTLARRRRLLGDNHPDTLVSADNLAADLRGLGEHLAARELDEGTLALYRRLLGVDHPDTLASASHLARDMHALGDYQAARELDTDTLARRRRLLGDDHPHTLISANNLAYDLRGLGEHLAARKLDTDTLARRRRLLGDDHPHTLVSADNLAADLRALSEHEAAQGWEAFVERHRRAP